MADDMSPTQWELVGACVGIVAFAGLMSGLTLGLMSVSPLDLQLKLRVGTRREQRHARRIEPLVKRPHLLLVTLLLWNAAAMEALPLVLDQLVGKVAAVVLSISAVLLFGEIIPQAICSRYGMSVGAYAAPLVYALLALSSFIAWPLAKLLDVCLGGHEALMYKKRELRALVDIHETQQDGSMGPLNAEEARAMRGALHVSERTVVDVMTPLANVFSLPIDRPLDRATVDVLVARGHSRVPLHEPGDSTALRSMLVVKMLLLREPGDERPARDIPPVAVRPLPRMGASTPLYDALNIFQAGGAHMALVLDDTQIAGRAGGNAGAGSEAQTPPPRAPPSDGAVLGIITLEDVLEELLLEEIVDETDEYVDVTRKHETPIHGRGAALLRSKSGGRLWGPSRSVGDTPSGTPLQDPSAGGGDRDPGLLDVTVVPSGSQLASPLDARQRSWRGGRMGKQGNGAAAALPTPDSRAALVDEQVPLLGGSGEK